MTAQFFIAYISPNGSTREVAAALSGRLQEIDWSVTLVDLADRLAVQPLIEKIRSAVQPFLFVGSPVYRDLAVPPVMNFIRSLSEVENGWAVPFVTWGTACSGVALWQMGDALVKKGFQIAGAAKVVGVHAMMWPSDDPAGAGRPNEDDRLRIAEMVDTLADRLKSERAASLKLEKLDYQPKEIAKEGKAKIREPWTTIPKEVDQNACSQCGDCETQCPVEAIELNPFPEFSRSCFDCFTCVRVCPERAIKPAVSLDKIEGMIRKRIETIQERPLTQIFL